MNEIDNVPRWRPRPDLNVEDLAYTLEHIRRVAYMHWLGNAFDPKHMLSICTAAAQALCGEPIDAPVDMNSPQWRAHMRERTNAWMALCDDDLEALGKADAGAAIVARLNRAEAAARIDDDLDDEYFAGTVEYGPLDDSTRELIAAVTSHVTTNEISADIPNGDEQDNKLGVTVARVETFVAALEHHGHGLSIVSCQYGHEAHWPGENREYVPLHAGDLRDLVDAVKRLRKCS